MTAIYKIENKINNKIYIGSAIYFPRRIKEHIGLLKKNKHHSTYLQNSWNKHGENNFIFEVIEKISTPEQLIPREQYWIDTLKPEYNICPTAGSKFGLKSSQETKDKISKNNAKYWLGKNISESTKEKMRESSKNYVCLNVTKEKISKAIQGENHPMYGKTHTEISKNKMSITKSKPIAQYSLVGEFIKEWPSCKQVQSELGYSQGNINKVCLNKPFYKQAYGFVWKFI
jgi:group I intron endonuclease